jgi:hypothetical protein
VFLEEDLAPPRNLGFPLFLSSYLVLPSSAPDGSWHCSTMKKNNSSPVEALRHLKGAVGLSSVPSPTLTLISVPEASFGLHTIIWYLEFAAAHSRGSFNNGIILANEEK